ncbi:glycerophosphodiester phosphodiesterase family protein [Microbulbifer litoralis]|uniref:glycerophosphodiester phosphodiesterase family protein n=1 Tax=Microbulbifer litoralis TaxID=2933965 RepID=UPI002028826E|nr:glycerophosphodiester phosphodiesterase family protein [Microbulbifer sp. GX H0434]
MAILFLALTAPGYESAEKGRLVAYRGGGQLLDYATFDHRCIASQILETPNRHIENTLQSIDASVAAGFDAIHLNLHHTADGKFAVFHDWTLDCATDGKGVTSEQTLDQLQSLDAGYGYTFDDGESFPWRGKGYRIPSLDEVVTRYPRLEIWLNLKTADAKTVKALLDYKRSLPPGQRNNFFHFAADENLPLYEHRGSRRTALSMASDKRCIRDYLLYGWSRFFPKACANTNIVVPPKFAGYLWGWPQQFAARAQRHGSRVYLWSKHRKLQPESNLLDSGIGIITGDIAGADSFLSAH